MKNKWFIKWLGYVKVRIEGRGAERFVNECVRKKLRSLGCKEDS